MADRARAACCEPLERRVLLAAPPVILFIRGADRSGGFLEGEGAVPRDAQLADINDTSTADNTGWGTLARTLRDTGFAVEQIVEPTEPGAPPTGFVDGAPVRFETMDLSRYAAIVFGSNNAQYPRASVDAIENYIRSGGGALFISDANFGSTWRDAPGSDQSFLSRFGLTVNQDNGVYPLTRAGGDFGEPDHPVLTRVSAFDGEGVSSVTTPAVRPPGVSFSIIASAKDQVRLNDGDANAAGRFEGSLRSAIRRDAALLLARAGRGRVATYFDRNTFFNAGGLGTDITRLDNRRFALNLFGWVADKRPPAIRTARFLQGSPSSTMRVQFTDHLHGSLTRNDVMLRVAGTTTPIPADRWSMVVFETFNGTQANIRISGAQPPGRYELQLDPGAIEDDSGNANRHPLRTRFSILSNLSGVSAPPVAAPAPVTVARIASWTWTSPSSSSSSPRLFDELFADEPIEGWMDGNR